MSERISISRRRFLIGSAAAGAGLSIGWYLPLVGNRAARAFAVVALGSICDGAPLPWNSAYAMDCNYRAATSTLTDGAAAVLLASEDWAKAHDLPVQAYLTAMRTAAVDFVQDEGLLMAPTVAVAEMLQQTGLTLQDFDFYEVHEAFAAQVLCTLAAWESEDYCRDRLGLDAPLGAIDRAKLNVKGSSLAVGHPFAATGARSPSSRRAPEKWRAFPFPRAQSTSTRRTTTSASSSGSANGDVLYVFPFLPTLREFGCLHGPGRNGNT